VSVTYKGAGTVATRTGNGNITPALYASWAEGDLSLLVIGQGEAAGTEAAGSVSVSAGWTLGPELTDTRSSGASGIHVYYRRMVPGDTAPTVTLSGAGGTSIILEARIFDYSGVKATGSPFNQTATGNTTTSPATVTGFTTTVDGCQIGLAVAGAGTAVAFSAWTTATSPGALTELWDQNATGFAHAAQATQGATGNATATLSPAPASICAALIALEPAEGAPAGRGPLPAMIAQAVNRASSF
jgi:hypothetical protein